MDLMHHRCTNDGVEASEGDRNVRVAEKAKNDLAQCPDRNRNLCSLRRKLGTGEVKRQSAAEHSSPNVEPNDDCYLQRMRTPVGKRRERFSGVMRSMYPP